VNYHRLMIMAIFTFLSAMAPEAIQPCLADDSSAANSLQPTSPAAYHPSTLSTTDSSHLPDPLFPNPLFTETFNDLDAWKKLTFPKISRHSSYTVVPDNGDPGSVDGKILEAQSDGSASGILWKGKFNVYEYPGLRWRWKIRNIYAKGNATVKEGDDYPVRLYVMFKYDPADPAVQRSLKYSLAKLFYGRTPPYTTLNYIWANREHPQKFLVNPYSDRAMMIVLRTGKEKVGQWVLEDIDIVRDYKEAFGTSPPAIAGLAIMNDSDNTGEASVSWVDDIEIYRVPSEKLRDQ
jgi:hypothetical protein